MRYKIGDRVVCPTSHKDHDCWELPTSLVGVPLIIDGSPISLNGIIGILAHQWGDEESYFLMEEWLEPYIEEVVECTCPPQQIGCKCGWFTKEMTRKGKKWNSVLKTWE